VKNRTKGKVLQEARGEKKAGKKELRREVFRAIKGVPDEQLARAIDATEKQREIAGLKSISNERIGEDPTSQRAYLQTLALYVKKRDGWLPSYESFRNS